MWIIHIVNQDLKLRYAPELTAGSQNTPEMTRVEVASGGKRRIVLCLFSLPLSVRELLRERNTHGSSHMHKQAE